MSILLYSVRDCAEDILPTLCLDETKATYDQVHATLNGYFDVRRNLIVQRSRFHKLDQLPGETVDTFIQDLYRLAKDCKYGSLKDGLIRDRIVVSVVDDSLSDRLQAKVDLTLETRGNTNSYTAINPTRVDLGEPQKRYSKSAMKPENGTRSKPERKCMWCGGQQHKRQSCPGKDVSCNSCHQRGQAVDLSKKHAAKRTCINEVTDLEEAEVLSLDEIYSGEADVWTAIAKVDAHEIHLSWILEKQFPL